MKRKPLVILSIVVLILVAVGAAYYFIFKDDNSPITQKKTPHFLDSTPLHGETYAAQPINVTINFDFDLSEKSELSVTDSSGEEWTDGEVLIEDTNTALKKNLRQGMGDGIYQVKYTACWPDQSCHDGNFSFSIDSTQQSSYKDMRGQSEVRVDMKDILFAEPKILVSPGTNVIWINQDTVGHFVNTETHPEHTYFPEQNSRELTNSQTFSQIFNTPGQYNYHCSAHAATMHASVIVSD